MEEAAHHCRITRSNFSSYKIRFPELHGHLQGHLQAEHATPVK